MQCTEGCGFIISNKSHASTAFFRLVGNPVCSAGSNEKYCTPPGQSNQATPPPYSTPKNCSGLPPPCLSDQLLSPSCVCAVPYRGTLFFRSPSFSDLSNGSYWGQLESGIKAKFLSFSLPVDSVALHDPSVNSVNNLQMALEVFPSGKTQFGEQDISDIGFILSNQTYKPPPVFGPYYFIGQQYSFGNGKTNRKNVHFRSSACTPCYICDCFFMNVELLIPSKSKANNLPLIIGVSAGGAVLVAGVLALVIFVARRKRRPKQNEERSQSFGLYSFSVVLVSCYRRRYNHLCCCCSFLGHEEHERQ